MAQRRKRPDCPVCGDVFDSAASAEEHFRSKHAPLTLLAERRGSDVVWRDMGGVVQERLSFPSEWDAQTYLVEQERADQLSRNLTEAHAREAKSGRGKGATAASAGKKRRDEAIRQKVRVEALAMRRRNPDITATAIAEHLSKAGGVSVVVPDSDNKVFRQERIGRELVSSVLRMKTPT